VVPHWRFWLSPSPRSLQDKEALEVVDSEYVCMVNDAVYEKRKIHVRSREGLLRLLRDVQGTSATDGSCAAIDPVSGKEVDKAKAVIGADSYKRVFYFENEKNFEKFKEAAKKK
jgi:YHS domain-containing protein